LRYYRTTGLTPVQMEELVARVEDLLDEPWDKGVGRPKALRLPEAVEIACMYLRHNVVQEFLGDMRHISQPTVSRHISALLPVVKVALAEFVPTEQDAVDQVRGQVCRLCASDGIS
jgi:Helix-turn-helix of DDE superfamily endonuclease